jgi:two-component system cell cycle response regulator
MEQTLPGTQPARILVVDDDSVAREALAMLLGDAGYDVCVAADGASALVAVQSFLPDLVISDVSMPHLGGFGLVQSIREGAPVRDVPIILISSHGETSNRVHSFEFGADDFMPKPVDVDELLARIGRHLQRAKHQHETARLSVSDELTGMLNRRGIVNFFARAQRECADRAQPISLLLIDITKFKTINDSYGHAAGDMALCATGRALQDVVRASDRVGRIGGDEFVVILPGADAAAAARLEERLRACLPIVIPLTDHDRITIDFAVGAATGAPDESLDSLTLRADRAMYAQQRASQEAYSSAHRANATVWDVALRRADT